MRMTIGTGPESGKELLLGPGARLRLGRGRDSDVVIHDPKASRNHAELTVEENGRVVLADLGSSNGTGVNGQRMDPPVQLRGDEQLWIGDTVLRLAPDKAAPGVTPAAPPAQTTAQRTVQ